MLIITNWNLPHETYKIKNNQCINKKTGKVIKAIIPVHVFGHACDIEKIVKIARKYKFEVIEDAAECLGSFFKENIRDIR